MGRKHNNNIFNNNKINIFLVGSSSLVAHPEN